MRLVNMTAKPFFTDFAARYDLTINEWRVMLALNDRPDLSVQEIAEVNGFDKMSASRAVRRLIARGRVTRATDSSDRRRTRHRLSAEGAAIFAEISPFALARADTLFGSLTAREVAQLKRILDKLETHAGIWHDTDGRDGDGRDGDGCDTDATGPGRSGRRTAAAGPEQAQGPAGQAGGKP